MSEGKKSPTGLRRLSLVAGVHPMSMMMQADHDWFNDISEITEVFDG